MAEQLNINYGKVVVIDLESTCWEGPPPRSQVVIDDIVVRPHTDPEEGSCSFLQLCDLWRPASGEKWMARFDWTKSTFIDPTPWDDHPGYSPSSSDALLIKTLLNGSFFEQSEVIEVGLCLLTSSTMELSRPRRIFIKPTRSTLSPFCTRLTGITPEVLEEKGKTRHEVLKILREEYKLGQRVWAGWGDDGTVLARQLDAPDLLEQGGGNPTSPYIDLQSMFSLVANQGRRVGLLEALKIAGLQPVGDHHNGGDDAFNAAQLMRWMLEKLRHKEPSQIVSATYTNWKGETELRRFIPQRMYFGSTAFHPEPQWLIEALDVDRQQPRTFTMKDFQGWKPENGG